MKMTHLYILTILCLFAAVPTLAFQQQGVRLSQPVSAASNLYQNQVGLTVFPSTKRDTFLALHQGNDNGINPPKKPSILRRLRRSYNLKKRLPPSSSAKPANFRLLQSLRKYTFVKPKPSNKGVLKRHTSRSLFGGTNSHSMRIWWQSVLKRIAALALAISLVFSPDPPEANAAADYFSTPSQSAPVERMVPSPYTVVPESGEDMSVALESNLYASQQGLASIEKESPSFSGGMEASNMARERAANTKALKAAQERTAAEYAENFGYRHENEAMAFGFVAASAAGAILGTRVSAGKTGGYSKYYPKGNKTEDSSDGQVGGFSQYKPKSPSSSPPPGVDEFLYNGHGLFESFRSGVGGFSKDFSEKDAAAAYFKNKGEEAVKSETWVGGFSQYKPREDDGSGKNEMNLNFQNKDIEKSYKLPSFEEGIDYDFKGINSFGLYRPNKSTVVHKDVADTNKPATVEKDGVGDSDQEVVGGFSRVGGFGRYRPCAGTHAEAKQFSGDAGRFSQYKLEAKEKLKNNAGFETFNELSGYKLDYDNENDDDDTAENKTGRIGGFSQYRPLEPPSSVYDSTASKRGKFSFFGGAGPYSQYKRKAIEEVNTPAPEASREDAVISPEAILDNVEAIEKMESERKTKEYVTGIKEESRKTTEEDIKLKNVGLSLTRTAIYSQVQEIPRLSSSTKGNRARDSREQDERMEKRKKKGSLRHFREKGMVECFSMETQERTGEAGIFASGEEAVPSLAIEQYEGSMSNFSTHKEDAASDVDAAPATEAVVKDAVENTAAAASDPASTLYPLSAGGSRNTCRFIPTNEATVEFTSGLWGGAVGLSLGGPIWGLLGASAANYVVRHEERGGRIGNFAQAVSLSTIDCVNFAEAVSRVFGIDELAHGFAQKEEVKTLLPNVNGGLEVCIDVLGAVGEFNFILVDALMDFSDEVGLPEKSFIVAQHLLQSIRVNELNGSTVAGKK